MGTNGFEKPRKKRLNKKSKKALNHLKLFKLKKNCPEWELELEEYKYKKLLT